MRSRFQNTGLLVALILVVLFGAITYMQTLGPNEVFVNQPFRIAADHAGADTTKFELRQGNTLVAEVPVAELQNGTIRFPQQSIATAGSYSFTVTAVGPGGATSAPTYTLVVRDRFPLIPTNTRVIREGEPGF